MFYDAHFTLDVTNWSRGIWLDGTTQIMDGEDILLSDRLVPAYLPEFPDDRRSASEALASMVGMAKIYDRVLTLADKHGLHVDVDEFSTLIVSSGGAKIGTMMVAMRRSGAELDVDQFTGEDASKEPIWGHFVDDLTHDPVIEHSRTPIGNSTQWRPAKPLTHSSRFHVYAAPVGEMTFVSGEVALTEDSIETLRWETNVGVTRNEDIAGRVQEMFDRLVVGASVMDGLVSAAGACGITLAMAGGSLMVAYFNGGIIGRIAVGASRDGVELAPGCLDSPGRSDAVGEAWGVTADAWWRKTLTVGENTRVAARWVHGRVKRHERKAESARLAYYFILCLEEMRGSGRGSPTWQLALSDARDRLTGLCDLAGVPAEEVIGFDI